ncbi:MAG: lipoyl synthase [Lachnospiraceae bacterium]|jgi:lipoic acid synthetase|nr:lipoyl synthase [Lachnospiraceae bacterium]
MTEFKRKPEWLKKKFVRYEDMEVTHAILEKLNLNTVCREADCPNYGECFSKRTATFMILGTNCTRNCRFCNVRNAAVQALDPEEPARIGQAVAELSLSYVVITSVTRDDLADGGAEHFANTIKSIRVQSPNTAIEVLIPDFLGDKSALKMVTDAKPDVISHNMETVKELYTQVRPQAIYERSLEVLGRIKEFDNCIKSKSGIMVGIGETKEQILTLFDDLREVGCEFLTIGQYLAPSKEHHPVIDYITPETFAEYEKIAYEKGFEFVASAPFVRSSYHAGEALGL